jgi:AzlC protein
MPTLTPLRRTDRDAARAGLVALAPLVTGLVPLGLAVGASAARAGVPPLVGWAASPLLYGASGQLTLTHVLGDGGPLWMAAAVTVLVNAQMGLTASPCGPTGSVAVAAGEPSPGSCWSARCSPSPRPTTATNPIPSGGRPSRWPPGAPSG